jgi:hypothetical protein
MAHDGRNRRDRILFACSRVVAAIALIALLASSAHANPDRSLTGIEPDPANAQQSTTRESSHTPLLVLGAVAAIVGGSFTAGAVIESNAVTDEANRHAAFEPARESAGQVFEVASIVCYAAAGTLVLLWMMLSDVL